MEGEDQTIPLLYFTGTIPVDEKLNTLPLSKPNTNPTSKSYDFSFSRGFFRFFVCTGCTTIFNDGLRNKFIKIPQNVMNIHDETLGTVCSINGKIIRGEDPQILYRQHGNNTFGTTLTAGGRHRAFKFFCNVLMKNYYYKEALIYRFCFYDDLSDEDKYFIDLICDYMFSHKKKRNLKKHLKKNIKSKGELLTFRFLLAINRL